MNARELLGVNVNWKYTHRGKRVQQIRDWDTHVAQTSVSPLLESGSSVHRTSQLRKVHSSPSPVDVLLHRPLVVRRLLTSAVDDDRRRWCCCCPWLQGYSHNSQSARFQTDDWNLLFRLLWMTLNGIQGTTWQRQPVGQCLPRLSSFTACFCSLLSSLFYEQQRRHNSKKLKLKGISFSRSIPLYFLW